MVVVEREGPRSVLLVNIPRPFSDAIRELLERSGVDVVGELSNPPRLLRAASGAGADVIVVGTTEQGLPELRREALCEHAHPKLLALVHEGERGYVYDVEPRTRFLGEVSKSIFLETIRETAGGRS
jgi:DNA-binding NarL/FixJ family response regulator